MTRSAAVCLVWLACTAGCTNLPRAATSPPGAAATAVRTTAPAKPGLAALRAELTVAFRDPAFEHAIWGVRVVSLTTGETLFALNPGTFLMPASNMKVITAAVAAERLGWNATFVTRLVSSAAVANGVLTGDLVIVGAGDPSLGGRPGSAAAVLDAWAAQLKAAGVMRIAGDVVGDDSVLDDQGLGQGWAWDYLGAAYATPISGLSFNENTVQLAFTPGTVVGDRVGIAASPAGHGLSILSRVTTGPAGSAVDLDYQRLPGSSTVTVVGSIPVDRRDLARSISVDNPTAFTAGVVRAGLIARGIAVDGLAVDGDAQDPWPDLSTARDLAAWTSPPLSAILKVLLKVSQNLYADGLLEVVGRTAPSTAPSAAGSVAAGRRVVQQTLAGWGVPADRYVMADGSGLSRYNYLSADVLTRVLTHMHATATHRDAFLDALPVAGVDGTISGRMKGTTAERNARAKTGSISNARSLSGFVTTADGEPLVFSCLVNHFNVPSSDADAIVDRVVARLASFRRR